MLGQDENIVFEPTAPEVTAEPYTLYDQLRRDAPYSWNPKGFWFLSRYDDVKACLSDPRFSNRPAPFALVNARNRDRFVAADVANNLMAFMDAPDHRRLRA